MTKGNTKTVDSGLVVVIYCKVRNKLRVENEMYSRVYSRTGRARINTTEGRKDTYSRIIQDPTGILVSTQTHILFLLPPVPLLDESQGPDPSPWEGPRRYQYGTQRNAESDSGGCHRRGPPLVRPYCRFDYQDGSYVQTAVRRKVPLRDEPTPLKESWYKSWFEGRKGDRKCL